MAKSILAAGVVLAMAFMPVQASAEEAATAATSSLQQEAEAYFKANTEQVLKDIEDYGARGNWWMVKNKAETLLGTGHPEIARLFKQAEDELAKEAKTKEDEARKQQEDQLAQAEAAINARIVWDIDAETGFNAAEKRMSKLAARNAIMNEPNCARVTTGYRSGSKPGSYYLTCDARNGGLPFNIWFTPQEIKDERPIGLPSPFPEKGALAACREAVQGSVSHPSTISFHVSGYSNTAGNNGNRTVILPFTAQNSFGVKLRHEARCLVLPDGKTEVSIRETGG